MRILLAIFSFVCALAIIQSCTSGNAQQLTRQQQIDRFTLLSPDAFAEKMKQPDVQLVDVREPEEMKYGYIAGSKNIDYHATDFEKQLLAQLKKDQPVLVYCMSGGRSEEAAQQLREMGFSEVYDLKGGIYAWEKAGMPVAK